VKDGENLALSRFNNNAVTVQAKELQPMPLRALFDAGAVRQLSTLVFGHEPDGLY
jgi:hypothetical protein